MRRSALVFSCSVLACSAALALALQAVTGAGRATAAEPAPSKAKPGEAIAVCDIINVVERLMDSDRYKPARDEAGAASEKAIADFRARAQAAEDALRGMDEKAEGFEAARREYQLAGMALQREGQRLAQEMDALTTKQLGEAYGVVRASAEAVADQLGYSYVIASRPADKPLDAADTAAVVRAMLARPVIRFPEGADITADVKQDLKID